MSPLLFHSLGGAAAPATGQAVEADGWVFVTGLLPDDPDDALGAVPEFIEDQTRQMLANLTRALAALGLGIGDVAVVRVYLARFERDAPRMAAVYDGYFPPARRPACSAIGVAALPRDCLVMLDVIARRPG
jgi:2-iminobutanoate/2-iminopropanoate deaminase